MRGKKKKNKTLMDLMVIRSNRQLESLIAFLKERNLPFACAIDEIYPVRSARFNAYYWGVVIKMIADHTGHSTEEVHEAYKKKYNLDLCFQFNQEKRIYEIAAGVMSTARENKRKFRKPNKGKRGEEDQTTRRKRKRHCFQACLWINLSPG